MGVTGVRKRIDISVTPGGLSTGGQYYAVARDENGREVAYAYGGDRREAVAKCLQKVRQSYPDAQVSY